MQLLKPIYYLGLLAVVLMGGLPAIAKTAEYKQTDTNLYLQAAVLKVDPSAVIIRPGAYHKKGDSYFVTTHGKAAPQVYLEEMKDWLEPITPPTMPASLDIAPDAMQIREPQGDVQVALPATPTSFAPATDGMTIPNGAMVKTGADGSAAVLFGGVNSARLVPNSEAAVQQTVTPDLRSTQVDLKSGAVFSKVGLRQGEKQDYQVHTPFGVASARGTDFATVVMPSRTDVWIAQGTVQLDQPSGQPVGTVSSKGTGKLNILRFPTVDDDHQAMMADAETMTAALAFIPMADKKVEALRDKLKQGTKLDANEKTYLSLIKKVPVLIAVSLVEPPAPAPPEAAPASTPSIHSTMAPMQNDSSTASPLPADPTSKAPPNPQAPVATGPGETAP